MYLVLVVVAFLTTSLLACGSATSLSCQEKLLDSHTFKNSQNALPITKTKRIVVSAKKLPNALKFDKFLGLNLIESKPFNHPFIFVNKRAKKLVANSENYVLEGKIVKHQIGLNKFATFNQPLSLPAVITNNCCALEGVVTPHGIIEKAYLQHFLKSKKVIYADIGIRIDTKKRVIKVDPFYIENSFKEGDIIVTMDGKKVYSSSNLMQQILFSKIGKVHFFTFLRNGKIKKVKVTTQKRLGSSLVGDTFLEHIGFYFDKEYKLLFDVQVYHLKKGDKIISINSKTIINDNSIYKAFNAYQDNKFLIKRNGFSFYIKVDALYKKYSNDDVRIFNN